MRSRLTPADGPVLKSMDSSSTAVPTVITLEISRRVPDARQVSPDPHAWEWSLAGSLTSIPPLVMARVTAFLFSRSPFRGGNDHRRR